MALKQSFICGYNYLAALPGTIRVVLKEYATADEYRRAELRLHNRDLDLDKMLAEMEKDNVRE
jgi:hypothetical protein